MKYVHPKASYMEYVSSSHKQINYVRLLRDNTSINWFLIITMDHPRMKTLI